MFEFTQGCEMMHKAWNDIEKVPYCFPKSSIKFQGHTGQKIDLNWVFLDCDSSFNSPMDLKWCTKLNLLKKTCPIVFSLSSIKFQGPMGWKIDNLYPIWVRLPGRSQLYSVWGFSWLCLSYDIIGHYPLILIVCIYTQDIQQNMNILHNAFHSFLFKYHFHIFLYHIGLIHRMKCTKK